jgi:hypothetical protein
MGLLKPIVDGRIMAITWKNDHGGLDRLGIIPSPGGIRFVKRDTQGKLVGVFVAYTHTSTMERKERRCISRGYHPRANQWKCPQTTEQDTQMVAECGLDRVLQ